MLEDGGLEMKKKGLWEENWRSVTNGVLEMYVV